MTSGRRTHRRFDPVPRHKEIKEGLAAHIIKMLSAPPEANPKVENAEPVLRLKTSALQAVVDSSSALFEKSKLLSDVFSYSRTWARSRARCRRSFALGERIQIGRCFRSLCLKPPPAGTSLAKDSRPAHEFWIPPRGRLLQLSVSTSGHSTSWVSEFRLRGYTTTESRTRPQ